MKLINALIGILLVSVNFFCSNNKSSCDFCGVYKMHSDDPAMQRFTTEENTFLELMDDMTIRYNSTINNKPKFSFSGTYQYNSEKNELLIKWNEGKLPAVLTIETRDDGNIIRIGNTTYKKEADRNSE